MKKYFTIIILAILMGNLFSYSILERFTGNETYTFDARTAALGQSGVANSQTLFGALNNPATLSDLKSPFGFSTTISLDKNSDDRSFPMYNFFDGYVDDATYVSNSNFYDEYAFSAYYNYMTFNHSFSFGISSYPFLNFDSNYEEQVRNDENSDYDNYPPIIANNRIESEGAIRALSGMFSYKFNNIVSVGFEVGNLSGEVETSESIIWTADAHDLATSSLTDEIIDIDNEYSGTLLKFGMKGTLNERVDLGFSYMPKIVLDNDFDDLEKPGRLKFGVTYQPQNIMKTYFSCDAELVQFSDINDNFDNKYNFYLGVEHQFMEKLPFRLGFNYQNFYQLNEDDGLIYADNFAMPTFSLGTGFKILDNLVIDVSAEISKREYDALDLFPDGHYAEPGLYDNIDPEDRGWENPDHIDESFIKIQTSINYKW